MHQIQSQLHVMPNRFIFIISIFTLASCQSLQIGLEVTSNPDSPVGEVLTANEQLIIPPGQAGIYLQFGKIVEASLVNVREVNCYFELKDVGDQSQIVEPGIIEVIKVGFDTDYVMYQKTLVASLYSFFDSNDPTAEIYETTYYLRSDKQPNVLYLTCQHWEDPSDGNYVTIQQIRQALGEVMTLS